jgi:KaiC/GvpD/RAD55 family RecA-like ATPase
VGFMSGVHSSWGYKQLVAAVDGIVDFKVQYANEVTRDLIRIRTLRKVGFDRKWHELNLGNNFEISLSK